MTFKIYEENIERLEKRLQTIGNKCAKYGCEFTYKRLGEVFETHHNSKTGRNEVLKFIEVEVEGVAKINDWRFVATLDHTSEGNVIRAYDTTVEVPVRYYSADPICEHCNSKRVRAHTYIVLNEVTGEFKQVGSSCLKDYTDGLSAEMVAAYISYFKELIQGEAYSETSIKRYYETKLMVRYMAETIHHFGFWSTGCEYPTKNRASDIYDVLNGIHFIGDEKIRKDLRDIDFNIDRPENIERVNTVLDYIASRPEKDQSDYVHNLQVVCACEYVEFKHFGLLASIFRYYDAEMKKEQDRKAREEANNKKASGSEYVGEVGKRITVRLQSSAFINAWENNFGGYTRLYEFIDTEGNVLNWFSSTFIDDPEDVVEVTGTVKKHNEYRGIKQTTLTRCKVVYGFKELDDKTYTGPNLQNLDI